MKPIVLQILPALDVGGVERGTLEIAKGLVQRGYGSYVISAGGRLVQQLKEEGSKHFELGIGKKSLLTLRHIPALKKIIKENNINIIHVRSRMPAWVAYLTWLSLKKDCRPIFMSTVHGPYSVNFYSKIMMQGQRIIAISNFIKNYILENYPDINPDKITVIYRGVDTGIFNAGFVPDNNWQCPWQAQIENAKKYVITLPARITHWKGQMDFIEIINKLVKSGLPVHGIIAGGPHKRKQKFYLDLKDKIHSLKLDQHISLIGHRNDMKEIMKMSDVVVSLAKIPEAFGRTALEALNLGTPVVAYNHGGASEVLNALFPEGLVPANDVDAAVEKIGALLGKEILINKENPFTLDNMINETVRIYESCLNN